MHYSLDFSWLVDAVWVIARGAGTAVMLIAVTTVAGTLLSILGAAGRRSRHSLVRRAIGLYVELVRNTPFLVQLFFIYFGLPSLGVRLEPITAAILAMTLNMAAYTTEIVGAGLDAVPKGQREAALALGLKPWQAFVKIVLPQALVAIYPGFTSQIIIMLLETSVVSQISVRELTYEADMLQSRTYRAFETYLVVTAIYLGLTMILRRVLVFGGRAVLGSGVS